jgi:ankyrin repeat protein
MKKTLIIFTIAVGSLFASHSANSMTKTTVFCETIEAVNKVNSFCTSIAKGDVETVKKLIDLGEDVNKKSNGMTPLMYAAKYNRVEIAELLIAKGAKMNTRSDKGYTAMKLAELTNAKEMIELLKEAKKNK